MPPGFERYAVVSCHVERPLDDSTWAAFARLQARRPSGFRIAALMRPPDPGAGESEGPWLERARRAAHHGPFGLHTHWTSPTHARPSGGVPARLVREQIEWLRAHECEPRFFCGGGWYTDEDVQAVVREAGLVDLTATTFAVPSGGSRVVAGPMPGLLPATHTLGMAARAVRLSEYVHVYFHDTDLVDRRRSAALSFALAQISRRRRIVDLEEVGSAWSR